MKIAIATFAFLALSAVAADKKPAKDDRVIHLTPEQMQACKDEGGCTIFSRDALMALIRQVQAAALKACNNSI